MDQQKVDMFIMSYGDKLPAEKILTVRERLLLLDDSKWCVLSTLQFKDPIVALVLSICLGQLGIDRFYIGDTSLGVGKLITCGGLGFWTIIDWFLILNATRERNYEKLSKFL